MLVRLLLAAVVLASPRAAFEHLGPAISKEIGGRVTVRVERVAGSQVDFEVGGEQFVGFADGNRVSWLTACFVRESFGRLCGRTPSGVAGEPLPEAVLPHQTTPGLIRPEALAVAKDGSLLILDPARGELFSRSPDGALHLVMPTAADAMAVARDGSIYLAGGGRVEVRAPNGALRTLPQRFRQVDSLAFAADGTLYVGAGESVVAIKNGTERTVIRGVGKFDQLVVGPRRFGGFSPDDIAVGRDSDLYVYTFGTKTVVEVTPGGKTLRFWSTYAHGLATAPDGSIVIGTQEAALQRIRSGRLTTIANFIGRKPFGFPFQEDGVAVGADGTIYIDTDVGNGYGNQTALAAVAPDGQARLLRTTTPLAVTFPSGYRASACPSGAGLRPFAAAAKKEAIHTAQIVDASFARGLRLSDPSWWPGLYGDQINGRYDPGRHRVYSVGPASADPYSGAVARRCAAALVHDSIAVVVGRGVYSDQVSHMFFLDRNGRALLYWQHT